MPDIPSVITENVRVYQEQFTKRLAPFRPFPGLDFYGADQNGIAALRQVLDDIPLDERIEFVSFMFLDALIDAALHNYRPDSDRRRIIGRPVFVLNSYNILNTPAANLSHRHPQSILGLMGGFVPLVVEI